MKDKHVQRETFNDVMVPNYDPLRMVPVRGEGSIVWDQAGKKYIDLTAGIAVNTLGHAPPLLIKTLTEQAEKLWHVSNIFTNEPALLLAKKLTDNTFAEKVFFAVSGAEANEAALKLARRVAFNNSKLSAKKTDKDQSSFEKTEIIAFHNGFHGRTFFTVSTGGQPDYSAGFGPKPGDITHINYNDINELEAAISHKTCAVILEPIQGEGGVIPLKKEFAQAVRKLCDKHNALLIFDEVQTGMGRTGELFAYMGLGVTPDILTSAKGLGGGIPIAAMLTLDKYAKHFVIGSHGTTFGGNPLACSVANQVFDVVHNSCFLDKVKEKALLFHKLLHEINDEFQIFSEIRGSGLLIGAALNKKHANKTKALFLESAEHGVLVLTAGVAMIRFTPALNIEDAEIEEGMRAFKKAVQQVSSAANQ